MEQQAELIADSDQFAAIFAQASNTIRDEGVSKYPIFVAHQQAILPLGIALIDYLQSDTHYSYQATTLEELVAKRVVSLESLDEFRRIYKNPDTHLCVLTFEVEEENFDPQPRFWFIPLAAA
jgi:hypothetical protein